ncbi:putative bifunctional diguanylate cyclase/phosphodiesterase [Actinoplanes lobatus]|nr:bifunctional diguanylate cyclase/phosphodiesterase [Actinoplanes lobatus]MBB4750125.1 diguanylate cyclase (GGDEF)-like protein [Actinoplanes lobatus]
MSGFLRHLWWIYLALAATTALAYVVVPFNDASRWVYVLVNCTAPIATWVGLTRNAPRRRGGWQVIVAGLILSGAGDIIFASYTSRGLEAPFPSAADGLYLLSHLAIAAGTALLATRSGRTAFLDSAVILAPFAGIAWLLVVDPLVTEGGTPIAQFVAVAAPVSTLIVLYCALALALGVELRAPGVRWLLAGLIAWFVSDSLYTHQSLTGTYVEGHLIDLGWMAMPILIATAGLHPSMVHTTPRRAGVRTLTVTRTLTLFGAALLLPTLQLFWEPEFELPLVVGTWVSVALVALRLLAPIHDLARRVGYDALTGLANRALLMDRLALALAALPTDGSARVGLLFCDLDHFKNVNDSLGHDAGDQLLVTIAGRLRGAVRSGDVVCRLGGDEFVILMPAVTDQEADAVADRVAGDLGKPVRLTDGSDFFASLSIGLRTTDQLNADPETLLQDADAAMYQAKAAGRGQVIRFDTHSRTEATLRLRRETDFRRALTRPGELFCVYQPVFRVEDGSLSSVEALARWQHPTDGILPPSTFVPVAETTGTVGQLFALVLGQSLYEQRAWYNRTGHWVPLSVNLSHRQLEAGTADVVLAALERTGTPAAALTLELTESGLALPETVEAALGSLRRAGVRIAVDDFGTGFSSMARVADHAWDIVKIDHTFVNGIATDPSRRALADAMIGMTHALGMTSLAEGVDHEADLAVLAELGCEYAQGYLLAHPVDATGIMEMVTAQTTEFAGQAPAASSRAS